MLLYKGKYKYEQRTEKSKIKQYQGDKLLCAWEGIPDVIEKDYALMKEIEENPADFFEYVEGLDSRIAISSIKRKLPSTVVIPEKIDGRSVVMLGDNLFVEPNANGVEAIILPDSLEILGEHCFNSCSVLKVVKLSEKIDHIPKFCFHNCENLEEINLENLSSVSDYAFSGTKNLKKMNLENLIECGTGAFSGSGVKNIYLPKINYLAKDSFDHCENLENVNIEGDLSKLNEGVFFGNKKLKNINLPDTIEVIGYAAFFECAALKGIKFPNSLKEIKRNAFSLSGIEVLEINKNIKLDEESFKSAKNLKEVIINSDIEKIPSEAFRNCVSLEKVTFSKDYRIKIGTSAFDNCIRLVEVANSESILDVSDYAFDNTKLRNIKLSGDVNYYRSSFSTTTKIDIERCITYDDLGR